MQLYRGSGWLNERTISVETLGETKFARCDLHTVRLISSFAFICSHLHVSIVSFLSSYHLIKCYERSVARMEAASSTIGFFS